MKLPFTPITMLCLFAVSAASAPAADAPAASSRQVFAEFAEALSRVLLAEDSSDVAVGNIVGPANFSTSAGPGFKKSLTEQLERKGIAVKSRAFWGISAEFAAAEIPASNADDARIGKKVIGLKWAFHVKDSFGNSLGNINFSRLVRNAAEATSSIGVNADLPVTKAGKPLDKRALELEHSKAIRKGLFEPNFFADGTVLRSAEGSPFGLQVLVNDVPLKIIDHDGLPFIELKRNDAYEVRIVNGADFDIATELKIDGLSMYAFAKDRQPETFSDGKKNPQAGSPLFSHVVVGKKSSGVVPGWFITTKEADQFLVTSYAKSAAAELNHSDGIGTITLAVRAAWPEKGEPPIDEPGKVRGDEDFATGRGERVDANYTVVTRILGVPRAMLSLRYAK